MAAPLNVQTPSIPLALCALYRDTVPGCNGFGGILPQVYGRIINGASITCLTGNLPKMERTVAYNTSKGGVIALTRALAAEWGTRGITVNAIAPGYSPSKMTRCTIDRHEQALVAHTPRGRLGGERDLVGPILLFASDAGAHITGQTLAVDGGYTAL